ncbi:MAG: YcaO-like family protein [Rhizobium sp.]|nr:YcaO-like family protein [Rhizobium sp.]
MAVERPSRSVSDSKEALYPQTTLDPELLTLFGITRVGDITDLDCLGVPVWFAVRPNSRGLSVSQGKGLTADQARISAVMEAIEGAVAEDTQRHVSAFGSVEQMLALGQSLIPFASVGRTDVGVLDPARERAWVRGVSIRTNGDVLAPFELIGMDFRVDMPWDRRTFHMSSQGLAAGFDYDLVVLHALLELVENDACFLIDTFETRCAAPRQVLLEHGVNPSLDALVAHLRDLGVVVEFHDLTTDPGVPVVMASLDRPVIATDGPTMRRSAGVACRLAPYDAALAALLEAVQSRLTDISGARDDLSPHRFQRDSSAFGLRSAEPAIVALNAATLELPADGGHPTWRALVDHLFKGGLEDIFVFSLETGIKGLHVVRVLASGLNAVGGGVQQMTPRMLERLMAGRLSS